MLADPVTVTAASPTPALTLESSNPMAMGQCVWTVSTDIPLSPTIRI